MRHAFPTTAATLLTVVLAAPPAPAACPDCDGNGRVTIDELVTGIGIALGSSAVTRCPSFDGDGNLVVSIAELVAAIGAALDGCAAAPSPTPTPSPTAPAAPPTDPALLLGWLQAGAYLGWAAESARIRRRARTAVASAPF
jgi:hypothetical protein